MGLALAETILSPRRDQPWRGVSLCLWILLCEPQVGEVLRKGLVKCSPVCTGVFGVCKYVFSCVKYPI